MPPPGKREVAKLCQVSRAFVDKIENELSTNGSVLHPNDERLKQRRVTGAGAVKIDAAANSLIYQTYCNNTSTSLKTYRDTLLAEGFDVSESTISRFLLTAYPFPASLRKPNLVPYDKFRPDNVEKAKDLPHFEK